MVYADPNQEEARSKRSSSEDIQPSHAQSTSELTRSKNSEIIDDPRTNASKDTQKSEATETGAHAEQIQEHGMVRACFECRCSVEIYDDFMDLRPEAIDRLGIEMTTRYSENWSSGDKYFAGDNTRNRGLADPTSSGLAFPKTGNGIALVLNKKRLVQHVSTYLLWVSYVFITSVLIAACLCYQKMGGLLISLPRAARILSLLWCFANLLGSLAFIAGLLDTRDRTASGTNDVQSAISQDFQRQSTNEDSNRRGGRLANIVSSIGNLVGGSKGQHSSLPTHHGSARSKSPDKVASIQKRRNPSGLQYLLLCVPYKRHANRLLNIDTSDLVTDQSFFRLLRRAYASHRGRFRHWLSIRALAEIRFVQFEVFRNELVDVRKYDTIPPLAEKDRYVYSPMPAEYIPPIGKNRMRHLYDHPEHADDLPLCFSRVPRRLRERLSVVPSVGRNEGWGICFITGVSWSRVCLLGLMGVLASTIFGVVWTVVQDDTQGGFGVASHMLGVLVLGLGALQGSFEV